MAQAFVVLRSPGLCQEALWSASTPTPLFCVASERNGAISSRGRQSAYNEVRRTFQRSKLNTLEIRLGALKKNPENKGTALTASTR